MARIPESELERLKAEVSVVRLAEAKGVKLVRRGKDLHGRCPFHADRTPSLVITPEANVWHCFGACDAGGTAIHWVMRAEGVSFRHAVELLRADLPTLEAASSSPPRAVKRSSRKPLADLARAGVEDQKLLSRVVAHYHETLKQSPEALAYLEGRGLSDPAMLERFRIGYANRTLGYRLPDTSRKEGAALRGRLKALGVLRESGHEHLAGSIVIPLFDREGRVVQMYGRKIRSDLRKGTPDHLYLPGPKRGAFNREGLAGSDEVILCESLLDALTFWAAGFRNVTTTYGVSGMPEDLWEAFREHGTKRVLIAYDRDEAGEKAAAALAKKLTAAGLAAYRIQFPRGMDANEYALKVQPMGRSLGVVVRGALWLGEGQAPERAATREPGPAPVAEAAPGAAREPEAAPEPACAPEAAPPAEAAPTTAAPDPTPEGEAPAPGQAAGPTPPVAEEEASKEDRAEAEAPAPASLPAAARAPALVPRGEDLWMELPAYSFRVRGLGRNSSPEALKVNLLVARGSGGVVAGPEAFYVDQLDLYAARQRQAFARQAAKELRLDEGQLGRHLGQLLLALELAQAESLAAPPGPQDPADTMSDTEKAEALELLQDPRLLSRILEDFQLCGVVGEEVNKLTGYLAAVSRKLERPLALVVQSNTAAGKSSLMEAVLSFMPEEETLSYSALTGQALFYMGDLDLRHRILALAEEEGAQRASYALKLLQSEGRLAIAAPSKDPVTGRLVTGDYRVEGPVMLFLTTTATDMDEELLNRCLVLTVDEGAAHTDAIHERQRARRTLSGKERERDKEATLRRHRNAQRLLALVLVVNPYAERLTFPSHQTRFRRDHEKYLTLIEAVAYLHQHQRTVHVGKTRGGREIRYVQVVPQDIAVANRLAHEILGRSVDELPPQTRALLRTLSKRVDELATKEQVEPGEVRFTRRQVREWTGLTAGRVHVHIQRLEELEYVLVHSGPRGKSFVYELLHADAEGTGRPLFPGLLDAAALGAEHGYDRESFGSGGESFAPGDESSAPILGGFRPDSGGIPGGEEGEESSSLSRFLASLLAPKRAASRNARIGEEPSGEAVVPPGPLAPAKPNGSRRPASSKA